MRKKLISLSIILTIVSCSNNEELNQDIDQTQQEVLTKQEIDAKIKNSIETTGDFNWMDTDANTIWSAIQHHDNLLSVGYGASQNEFMRSAESEKIKDEIIALIKGLKNSSDASKEDEELYIDDTINVIDITVNNRETIEALLSHKSVRYLEPASYKFLESEFQARSDKFGCSTSDATISSADYRTVSPGARVPWNFDIHNIPAAWNYSTGAGITVAVVDTGLSSNQSWMQSNFNDGASSGRTVQRYGTFVDSWWWWSTSTDGVHDKCGHGTQMSAVATAPRNNNNLPMGVAYNANLVSYRAVENVLIDDYHEKKGVGDALKALGNRSDVKIISMSIGNIFSSSRVSDGVKYAYNRGKLIMAAGGTSTTFTNWAGVIFPANMNETVAVTGLIEGTYTRCDNCHSGSKIDFTIEMQRSGSGNKVPVLNRSNGSTTYVGGSSIATATAAGIAALVWSKNPTWSRDQVLNKLKQSAEFYPNRNSSFGYGNIDALKAVQ